MPASAPVRLTPQRQAVLDVLRSCTDHPTAAEVLHRVRRRHPGIGAATVYRSLGVLVEAGEALELSLGDGAAARYDGNTSHHDHVVCERCGRAVDVARATGAALDRAAVRVAADTGFVVSNYELQFRGRCPACRNGTETSTPSRSTN